MVHIPAPHWKEHFGNSPASECNTVQRQTKKTNLLQGGKMYQNLLMYLPPYSLLKGKANAQKPFMILERGRKMNGNFPGLQKNFMDPPFPRVSGSLMLRPLPCRRLELIFSVAQPEKLFFE